MSWGRVKYNREKITACIYVYSLQKKNNSNKQARVRNPHQHEASKRLKVQ